MVQNLTDKTLGNRYRFETVIGEGTFARVYRVHDLKRNVDLAAKVLREDIAHEQTFIERFKREANVLQKLQHPNIVRYYETVETDGAVFILLDYIPGDNLQTYLYKIGEPLTVAQALGFMKPITAALSYAHGEDIIHRDIKPANIILGDNGGIYITDFGIARLLNEASTLTLDSSIGTPLYMSPEQILGNEITRAADIYAIGVLLYQMLTGKLPFIGSDPKSQGNSVADRVAYEHVNLAPPSPREQNPILPKAAEDVILRCLKKEPTSRYRSAIAVYDALAESIGATPAELDAVSLVWEEGKAIPPDVKLPEWSRVVPKVANSAVTMVSSEVKAEEDAYERPTQNRSPFPNQRQTEQHIPIPQPQYSQQSPFSSGYNPPKRSYRRYPAPRSSSGQNLLIMALVAVIVLFLTVICVMLIFLALGIFEDDNSKNPTPRSTSAVQLATTIESHQNGTNLPPITVENTDIAANETPITRQKGYVYAYAVEHNGNTDIFLGNTDGSPPIQLTSSSLNETGPAFSPDGTQIAYYAYRGAPGIADIWIMNADGSAARQVTDTDSANERVVSWSPDGTQLAYHSDADSDFDIYILNLNTGESRNLTNSPHNDLGPSWSPDGTRIAFHSDQDRNFNEIFVINVDGSNRQQVTDGQWQAAFAAWRDNNRLAFHAIITQYQIYAINADGSGFEELFPETRNQRHADWSEDGQRMIYMVGSNSNPDIVYTDFTTGETVELVSDGFYPDWKP